MATIGGLNLGGGSLAGGINSIGSAVGDLYSQEGDEAEAQNYRQAAALSREEAQFTVSSTNISEMQADRQVTQAIGGVKAAYGGNGISTNSGSALDVLGSSAQQGAMTKAAVNYQGAQQEYQYNEQAISYDNMANAADKAAQGAGIGALISGVAGVANLALLL